MVGPALVSYRWLELRDAWRGSPDLAAWERVHESTAKGIAKLGEELGGLSIKLCQVAGARADVFPPVFIRELGRFLSHLLNVVEDQRLRGVLDQVEHVVHARDEPVNVVAIEGRDERGMEQLHGVVRDPVRRVLDVVDLLDARGALLLELFR